MIQPRYYQSEAIQSLYNYFASGSTGNPLIALPTGTGKSIVIANFIRSVLTQWPSQRIIVATHVKELVEQNYNKLIEAWPEAPAGVYSAGLNQRDFVFPIIFGGIQSMVKQAAKFGYRDLLIVDEAHLISGKDTSNYSKFIAALKLVNPHLRIIGLTATKYRMGSGLLADGPIFTDVCCDYTSLEKFNRLIDEGYMCMLIPKRTQIELNIDDVHIQNGDYVQNQLQDAVDKDATTYAACKEIIAQGQDRNSWLIFASGVKHSDHIASCLQSFGIAAVSVHSKMDDDKRDAAIRDFKSGKIQCIVNNNVLTTGFDHPGIDLIAMLRPTVSTVLWVQMLGRGTRPCVEAHKPNCLVLDFAGNTKRLGPINDPVIPRKRGDKGDGVAPVKICEVCGVYNHARATICIGCGAKFEMQSKLTTQASTDALVKREDAPPIVEEMPVMKVIYRRHQKSGSVPVLEVAYMCGLQMHKEYVALEHSGMARRKAENWWKQRSQSEVPTKVDEALQHITSKLAVPRAIRVWTNKKYPEVMATIF